MPSIYDTDASVRGKQKEGERERHRKNEKYNNNRRQTSDIARCRAVAGGGTHLHFEGFAYVGID